MSRYIHKKSSAIKFSFVLITIVWIIVWLIIQYREEMNESYQKAKEYMNNGSYESSIKLFREIPSSYKDVSNLEKQASTLLVNECERRNERAKQEEDFWWAGLCHRNIEELQLTVLYEKETGNNLEDMINTLDNQYEQEKRLNHFNEPPYVGMSREYINYTSWGPPSETSFSQTLRNSITTYTWYKCENGRQYTRHVNTSKNGSVFFISSEDEGIPVSDISPRLRKCPR